MLILGIESSCDETAAAVVRDGQLLLSNIVASQIDIHKEYGGVVPEIAARSHIEVILPVINQALDEAKVQWEDIDAIAVTQGPGLLGSLLIGSLTARTIAKLKDIQLIPVNHVEAHVYANFLVEPRPEFPMLALIVSGGHTQLVLFSDHHKYQMLGQTRDDAVGEAFDKVAKLLGLPYPGGPSIEIAAKKGDPNKYKFPHAKLDSPYDFSFSGLKTAVLRKSQVIVGKDYTFPSFEVTKLLKSSEANDIAASFQKSAIDVLVNNTLLAYSEFNPKSVVIGGGVASSPALRESLKQALPIEITYAPRELCTDNGAMIATLGFYKAKAGEIADPITMTIEPSLSM